MRKKNMGSKRMTAFYDRGEEIDSIEIISYNGMFRIGIVPDEGKCHMFIIHKGKWERCMFEVPVQFFEIFSKLIEDKENE